MIERIVENQLIAALACGFTRSPMQINRLHEADAEIIQLPGDGDALLAVTTDSVVEEIASGLYADPYLIGWMTVTVNMSDLAAVGANPIGLLVSEILPKNIPEAFLSKLQQGIQDACSIYGTHVLGGDTNFGEQLMMSGCAIGLISGGKHLTRIGARAGDILYSSGKLGAGNAYAVQHLTSSGNSSDLRIAYRPTARLKEGQLLRRFASSCMDSSDGFISTVDQLMRLNTIGFEIDERWTDALEPTAKQLALECGIPFWLLLAGQHGEFELVFTVPAKAESAFRQTAAQDGWAPLRIGRVIDEPVIELPLDGRRISLDTARIRNLLPESNGDIQRYLRSLLQIDVEIRTE